MIAAYLRSMARRFLRRAQNEREMHEELESHVQLRADALERVGLERAEAERRARIEFGSHVRFKEECREALGGERDRPGGTGCPIQSALATEIAGILTGSGDHACARHWRDGRNVFSGEHGLAAAVCIQPSGKTALDLFAT